MASGLREVSGEDIHTLHISSPGSAQPIRGGPGSCGGAARITQEAQQSCSSGLGGGTGGGLFCTAISAPLSTSNSTSTYHLNLCSLPLSLSLPSIPPSLPSPRYLTCYLPFVPQSHPRLSTPPPVHPPIPPPALSLPPSLLPWPGRGAGLWATRRLSAGSLGGLCWIKGAGGAG